MSNHPQMSEPADEHGMTLHYGRQPEHEHKFEWAADEYSVWGTCKICDSAASPREMLRRLNATEIFGADEARELSALLRSAAKQLGELLANDYGDTSLRNFRVTDDKDELLIYAAALEGEVAPR